MKQAIDKWTVAASAVLVLGVLLACKKKDEPAPAASAPVAAPAVSIAPLPTTTAAPTAAAVAVDAGVVAPPVLGDVKRFPDKEKAASGAVKVTIDNAPVFDEPDDKAPSVATLSKDIFVERIATLGTDFVLVSFPSGVGKLSPGWIDAKSVGAQVTTVTHAVVAAQTATAAVASAKPAGAPSSTAVVAAPKTTTTTTAPAAVTAPPAATTAKPRPQMMSAPKH